MFDLTIIGAGPAGIACALRSKELNMNVLLLEQGKAANTIRNYSEGKRLFGVPGFYQRMPSELVEFYKKDLEKAKVELREESKALSITKKDGFFEIATKKQTFRSIAVVLAVGVQGTPQTLGIPGEDKKHVRFSLDDPKKYKGKCVVVVGGGDTAVEAATSLADAGAKTFISYRRTSFFRANELNVAQLEKSGAEVKFATNLTEIKNGSVILRHATDFEEEIKADYVFVLLGAAKNTGFFRETGLKLDENENLVYDENTLETSIPGIFAAGDVISKEKLIMPAMYLGFKAAGHVLAYKSKNKKNY